MADTFLAGSKSSVHLLSELVAESSISLSLSLSAVFGGLHRSAWEFPAAVCQLKASSQAA